MADKGGRTASASTSMSPGGDGRPSGDMLVDELLKLCAARCEAAGLRTADVLNAMLQRHAEADAGAVQAPAQGAQQPTTGDPVHTAQTGIIKVPKEIVPGDMVSVDMRYHGCLIGLAIGDAIGIANGQDGGSGRASSLHQLNTILGGSHDPLHDQFKKGKRVQVAGSAACGLYGIAVGGWSHLTASCLATVESVLHKKGLDTRDMMMRLLRLYRTGQGSCVPGHSAGIDTASELALDMFERQCKHSPALHGCSSPDAANSAALARVPSVVLLMCRSSAIDGVAAAAADNTRATVRPAPLTAPCRLQAPPLPSPVTPCNSAVAACF